MATALLHYWLHSMRGGEKVLLELCRLFPDAPIYTHAVNQRAIVPELLRHRIRTSFIARFPGAGKNSQRYLPLMPLASSRWDLSEYDLIVSSESGPVKNIRKPQGSTHICYCHTPMRYLWDLYDEYYRSASLPQKGAMRLFRDQLRRRDLESAETVDFFIANSICVADRIRRIYRRKATVIHPPVDYHYFSGIPRNTGKDYWLWAGELTGYKRPDLAVEACRKTGEILLVAGSGVLLRKLRKNAPPNVHFLGRVSDEKLRELYAGAKGLLFPGLEDFGLVPVEAQAAGCPVVACRGGGSLETVKNNVSGLFFPPERGLTGLLEAMEEFRGHVWDTEAVRSNAARFSRENFQKAMRDFLRKNNIAHSPKTEERRAASVP